jgi:hypothetical protein
MTIAHDLGAGGAGLAAGLINAVAGGGTLVSFPVLVALGVPAVAANVTNTVSLCPGYLGGAWAQRATLTEQSARLRAMLGVAGVGGLVGSILLVSSSETLFRSLVPYLILAACALLAAQPTIKKRVGRRQHHEARPWGLLGAVFACAVYGGYFGAGLGIMLLAVLGIALDAALPRVNALKQALSLVINVLAAAFFVFSGKVHWHFAAIMAVTSLVGGNLGGRLVGKLNPSVMRVVVIVFGLAAAIKFWL